MNWCWNIEDFADYLAYNETQVIFFAYFNDFLAKIVTKLIWHYLRKNASHTFDKWTDEIIIVIFL